MLTAIFAPIESMFVGVDIGTGSVRSFSLDGFSQTCDISTVKHNEKFITQSSKQVFDSILKTLPTEHIEGICFAATCSMVVKEKVNINGTLYLKPFNCGPSDPGNLSESKYSQDIILWMDNRPVEQCEQLNEVQHNSFMKSTITKFIPELGIPKLKWLSDNFPDRDLYCFELYDWYNYVFQVGYSEGSELVEFKLSDDVKYQDGSNGIDGSIKGWAPKELWFINENIHIGKSESVNHKTSSKIPNDTSIKLPNLGDYIGNVSTNVLGDGSCEIFNGCIDCYAGWICTLTDIPNSVSMIAGTSTCFVMQTSTGSKKPIPGIWGPFELINNGAFVYSFGQPATGKLFEDLFAEFDMAANSFDVLDRYTQELEQEYQQPITELIKHYYYYGDKYGNRNPLMDFNMSEMYIDGKNASKLGVSVFAKNKLALVIRYNLIMEFLCFQTDQLLTPLLVNAIIISGSQGKNQRFLRLLNMVTNKDIYIVTGDNSLNVAKGALILARNTDSSNISTTDYKKLAFEPTDLEARILTNKKQSIYDLISIQRKCHQL